MNKWLVVIDWHFVKGGEAVTHYILARSKSLSEYELTQYIEREWPKDMSGEIEIDEISCIELKDLPCWDIWGHVKISGEEW